MIGGNLLILADLVILVMPNWEKWFNYTTNLQSVISFRQLVTSFIFVASQFP